MHLIIYMEWWNLSLIYVMYHDMIYIYPNVVMIIKQLGRNLLCRVENETDSAFMNITLFLDS